MSQVAKAQVTGVKVAGGRSQGDAPDYTDTASSGGRLRPQGCGEVKKPENTRVHAQIQKKQ